MKTRRAPIFDYWVSRSRSERGRLFRECFKLSQRTLILDLGCGWGTYMAEVLSSTPVSPRNVHAADIDEDSVARAERDHGFTGVRLRESERLPFPDKHFDIVFCNSVIEHVTVPKEQLFEVTSERVFRKRSLASQRDFAAEIRRVGKGYFVQTPNRWFPVESHTRLPFLGWLPRQVLIALIRTARLNWCPDWNLLTVSEMRELFPDAEIVTEKLLGMVKSIIAIKKWEAVAESRV